MRKLHEKDWKYSWGRIWVDDVTRSMFSGITSIGKENVPADGAVLLAPNHCNTVMDALVILQDWKEATLYGARADIFKKPAVRKILRFLRILPLPRSRDGAKAVLENRSTMEEVVDCLDHGMKYCMFCEGTHRPMHSLLPLKKGLVRTALLANERMGARKPVYIVPVGLEYQDYYRIRTPMTIRYGEAINVTEFVSSNPEMGEGRIYRELLDLLRQRLSSLIICLPDDETYEGRWALTKISGPDAAMKASPEILNMAAEFDKKRKAAGLSSWSFSTRPGLPNILLRSSLAIVLSPIILAAAVLSAPMWLLSAFLTRRIKDKAFVKTARLGVKFVMMPPLLIVWAVVFAVLLSPTWAPVVLFLTLCSHTIFYEALERGRVLLSDICLLSGHDDLKKTHELLKSQII